jgi:dTDP-D-glucose 4,6-dehydratase
MKCAYTAIYAARVQRPCWRAQSDEHVINLDKFIYAGNLENLASRDAAGKVLAEADCFQ